MITNVFDKSGTFIGSINATELFVGATITIKNKLVQVIHIDYQKNKHGEDLIRTVIVQQITEGDEI